MILFARSTLSFDDTNETLRIACRSYGNYKSPANFQLRHEWFRYVGATSGNENTIIRSVSRPTERAVEALHGRIINTQLPNLSLCLTRQIPNPLD